MIPAALLVLGFIMAPATTGLAQNCNTNFNADGNQVYDTVCLGSTVNIQLTPSCSAESVAQAWVSVVDSTGNSNAVSLSPTNNTYYGSYSAEIAGLFTIYGGDSCQGEWSSNITLAVVQLTGLSASMAQNIDDYDYAAMADTNPASQVLAIAQLTPNNSSQAANLVTWQDGHSGPACGVTKTNPSETVLTASCCNVSFSIDVWVISAVIKSLQFTSDHAVMTTNNSDWTDCNVLFTKPEWFASPYTNNPISQTMNTYVTLKATVNVQPADLPFDLYGNNSDTDYGWLDFRQTYNMGSTADQTFNLSAIEPLPDEVGILSDTCTWGVYPFGGSFNCLSSTITGPHTNYVTYDTPIPSAPIHNPPTQKRMAYICGSTMAAGLSDTNSIVNTIGPATMNRINFGPFTVAAGANHIYDNPWEVFGFWHNGGYFTKGDCSTLAWLMKFELKMLGVDGAETVLVHPCSANWNALLGDAEFEFNAPNRFQLVFYNGGGLNYYEGGCRYNHVYWCAPFADPGIGLTFSSAWNVLQYVSGPNNQNNGGNVNISNHQAWSSDPNWPQGNFVAWPQGWQNNPPAY